MVEVLCILSIATKELKQSRASELIHDGVNCSYQLTGYLGKYVKKLVGRTDIEDALSRLDRLTHDEVGMTAAQGLSATHKVDDKVKGVGDRVRDVDNKIDLVIDGVQTCFQSALASHSILTKLGGEKIREEIKQVADDQKR